MGLSFRFSWVCVTSFINSYSYLVDPKIANSALSWKVHLDQCTHHQYVCVLLAHSFVHVIQVSVSHLIIESVHSAQWSILTKNVRIFFLRVSRITKKLQISRHVVIKARAEKLKKILQISIQKAQRVLRISNRV